MAHQSLQFQFGRGHNAIHGAAHFGPLELSLQETLLRLQTGNLGLGLINLLWTRSIQQHLQFALSVRQIVLGSRVEILRSIELQSSDKIILKQLLRCLQLYAGEVEAISGFYDGRLCHFDLVHGGSGDLQAQLGIQLLNLALHLFKRCLVLADREASNQVTLVDDRAFPHANFIH